MLLFGVLLSNLESINVWVDAQDEDEHLRRAKPKGTGSEGISPTPKLAEAYEWVPSHSPHLSPGMV